MSIIRSGQAKYIFFPNGMGAISPEVTIYESGVVHFKTPFEETTTHVLMCEVVWNMVEDESMRPKLAEVRPLRGEGDDDNG